VSVVRVSVVGIVHRGNQITIKFEKERQAKNKRVGGGNKIIAKTPKRKQKIVMNGTKKS